jgi:hypothetical protein
VYQIAIPTPIPKTTSTIDRTTSNRLLDGGDVFKSLAFICEDTNTVSLTFATLAAFCKDFRSVPIRRISNGNAARTRLLCVKYEVEYLLGTSSHMPMFFFRFEVRPKQTHPKRGHYAGAMVNCWVLRDTQAQAEAVARGWIGDEDWRITGVEEATLMTRERQAEFPDGIQYFEQAEIDSEVFVFHTWPVGAADDGAA